MADIAAPGTALSTAPATAAVCPYLLGADGAWRASSASRDHRCHAVAPPAALATDKQRRLCLVAEHLDCSTYKAAFAAYEEAGSVLDRPLHRPVTRTAPLFLDRGRISVSMPGLPDRGVGQGGLVALMIVAFGALAVSRLGGGPGIVPAAADPSASGTPPSSVAASIAPATPAAESPPAASPDAPVPTLVPSEVEPSPTPAATPTPPATTPKPSSAAPTTYRVRSGDTLSGIAAVHGTTWQVLAELNGLDDPRRLRVGQVLKLP
ncbi:MAG TPA: LysM peptidoglycan-binding domain-containing protein [Candidatus Limnocylindrales bacterium]|jgi:LysM repeat protein